MLSWKHSIFIVIYCKLNKNKLNNMRITILAVGLAVLISIDTDPCMSVKSLLLF